MLRFPRNIDLTDSRAARMLAAGNVTVTVKSKKTGEHITVSFAVRTGPHESGKRWRTAAPGLDTQIFINGGRYDRLGVLAPYEAEGEVRWSYRKPWKPEHNLDSKRIWAATAAMLWLCGEDRDDCTFQEASQCGRCKRELTDPVSIERGIGPECWGKVTQAQHQKRQPDQRSMLVGGRSGGKTAEVIARDARHAEEEHAEAHMGRYPSDVDYMEVGR